MTRRTLLATVGVLYLLAPTPSGATTLAPSDLHEGLWVEVQGELREGKRFKAEEVEIKRPDPDRNRQLRGALEWVDPSSRTVGLIGTVVVLDELSVLQPSSDLGARSPFELASGAQVKVSGLVAVKETGFRAAKLRVLELDEYDDESEVEGWLENVEHDGGRTTFEVNGVEMSLSSDAEISVQDDALDALVPDLAWVQSRSRADEDWQPSARSFLHQDLSFGGRVTARVSSQNNELDLNAQDDDEITASGVETRLYAQWTPSPWVEGYGEVRWSSRRALSEPTWADDASPLDTDDARYRSGPTYLHARLPALPWLALQVGRLDLEDDREWFYDQNLDGIRLLAIHEWVRLDVGVYRTDITPTASEDDDVYQLLNLAFSPVRVFRPEIYVIRSEERRDRRNDRTWTGLRAPIRWKGIETWSDWLIARGDFRDRTVRSWAFDNGGTFRWTAPFRGSISFGYGFATGDSLRGDEIDREFRDTGLSDNTDNFDGLKSFRYYGELTDPELSNIHIKTFAVGAYLAEWLSVDAIHHRYRQDQYRDRFRSAIELRPNEVSKDIGEETDIVVGLRGLLPVDLEFNWSRFSPGPAFDVRDAATAVALIAEWRR